MNADEIKKLIAQYPDDCVVSEDGTAALGIPVPGHPDLIYVKTPDGWEVGFAESVEQLPEDWDGFGYDIYTDKQGRRYRTKIQAERAGAITDMPEKLSLITLKEYRDGLRPTDNDTAYLRPLKPEIADRLRYINGTLLFEGVDSSGVKLIDAKDIDLSLHYDMETKTIADLDLMTLRALYSIILQDVQNMAKDPDMIAQKAKNPQFIGHSVKIHMSSFLKMMGDGNKHLSGDSVEYAIKKIMSYSHIIGVLEEYSGGTTYRSFYPVLVFHAYDDRDGTLTFASPYINKLIITVFEKSIQRDKKGHPRLSKTGKPIIRASHSRLIKSSILQERNRRACEIVCYVVETIEMAGKHAPRIRAQTIVAHCPDLNNALDAATPSNRSLILKRAFSKAWELLRTQTTLEDTYRNICIPTEVPTYSELKDMIFEFPHLGKINATKVPNSRWQPNWSKPDLGKPWEDDEDPAF